MKAAAAAVKAVQQHSLAQSAQEAVKTPERTSFARERTKAPGEDPERLRAIINHFAPNLDIDQEAQHAVGGQYRPAQAGGRPSQNTREAEVSYANMTDEEIDNFIAKEMKGS